MDRIDFVEWLLGELDERNWSKADLARASGISSAQITRIVKREQNPGPETCNSIAQAFKLPPEMVFRVAGLLPLVPYQVPEEPPTLKEWIFYYLEADEEERDRMLEIAKTLSKRSRKD